MTKTIKKYIDRQGYIYYVKKRQIKPDKIVWCPFQRRYHYYKFTKRGHCKLIPFRKVHARYLFWPAYP